jgi:hypothetical protein
MNPPELIEKLQAISESAEFTEDERACAVVVVKALEDIAAGGDLSPPPEGQQKMRLLRRVTFSFFHHAAPRAEAIGLTHPKQVK